MITADSNDYVIIQVDGKRNLIKVKRKEKENYVGVYEAHRTLDNPEEVEFAGEDIVALLGKEPLSGSVFGCNTEIFRHKKRVDGWGKIFFYRNLEKEELKTLRKAMQETYETLVRLEIPLHPFDTEVREAKGKWDGWYKYRPKKIDGESIDLICLKPKSFDNLKQLLFHELGHSIWYRNTTAKTQAKWILAYHKAIELQDVNQEEVTEVLEEFCSSGMRCKEFSNGLSERENLIFDRCIDFVDEAHLLSKHHLDTLIASDHNVDSYFHAADIKLTDVKLVLTEYAQESPEEFFAEAFSLHMSGSILPKSLRLLMEKTLQKAKHFVDYED